MKKINLEDNLGTIIFLASKSLERAAEYRMKDELNLTPSQWKVILTLNLFNGISQKELAGKMYVDGSTLVPVIDKMEQKGLVERKPDPKDRRNNMLFLTKKSQSTVDSIIDEILQLTKEFFKDIAPKEQEHIKKILMKIIDNANNIVNKK